MFKLVVITLKARLRRNSVSAFEFVRHYLIPQYGACTIALDLPRDQAGKYKQINVRMMSSNL